MTPTNKKQPQSTSPMRRIKNAEAFNFTKTGCFGNFQPDSADTQIFYIQTTFHSSEISHLTTARDALRNQELNFDELIQREINEKHVQGLVEYLSNENTPRLLPPLLAALTPITGAHITNHYPALNTETTDDGGPALKLTWGNLASCTIAIADADHSGATIQITTDGAPAESAVDVIPYLCSLKTNTSTGRLVVVDGQHRLKALQRILGSPTGQDRLKNLSVPVLIFFPPWASKPTAPTVSTTLRKLFVDINKGAKSVSGHFLTLLNDNDIDALAVRTFCEAMRSKGLLWHIEWNEHEDKRSNQLNQKHSFTGVGVLRKSISAPGISRSTLRAIFRAMLGAPTPSANAETEPFPIDWDSPFQPGQSQKIKEHLNAHFTPAIAHIYENLAPYKEIAKLSTSTLKEYRQAKDITSESVISHLKNASQPETKKEQEELDILKSSIADSINDNAKLNIQLYRTQRFQQGLIGCTYETFHTAVQARVKATFSDTTKALTAHLNETAFSTKTELFRATEPWLRGTVLQQEGADIIAKNATREKVRWLLMATLGAPKAAEKFSAELVSGAGKSKLAEAISKQGQLSCSQFWTAYLNARVRSFLDTIDYTDAVSKQTRDKVLTLFQEEQATEDAEAAVSLRAQIESISLTHLTPELNTIKKRLERILGYKITPHSISGANSSRTEEE